MQCPIDRVSRFVKASASIISALFLLATAPNMYAGVPAQKPVFLSAQVQPLLMLNMSRDHQLYFRLYDDYADITDSRQTVNGNANTNYGLSITDGNADTTYVHGYNYFGYFDSNRCYTYDTTDKRFEPSTTASKTCVDMWSGNFLNWATMTRIDAIRKILYGGKRVVDSTTETVLERSYLPNDTHSFAKFYNGTDLANLVPAAVYSSSGITLCNTTDTSATYSQNATEPPLIKVARGDYSLWANNERWQCKWLEQKTEVNGNVPATSGLNAASSNPKLAAVGSGSYVARVQTCLTGRIGDDEGCTVYGSSTTQKPIGLLQEYGNSKYESDNITVKQKASVLFGLMTGSYDSSKSGGVLRKAIGALDDEVNPATGQFKTPPTNNVIDTLNLLRIYGYDTTSGLYMGGPSVSGRWYSEPLTPTGSDNCGWIGSPSTESNGNNYPRAFFDNARCSNWGNPQAEIYLESLRYLAGGAQKTDAFAANDTTFIPGLNSVTEWSDPISAGPNGNYCAPLNVLMFNASVTSYDADELSSANAIGLPNLTDLSAKTDAIGIAESIAGNNFFIGKTPSDNNELCTAKNIASLSGVSGICPEAPRLEGGYQMAGLAYHARSTGIASAVINGKTEVRKVKTFAVAMAPATPKVTVRVNPASTTDLRTFTIIPACRNTSSYLSRTVERDSSCAIVDFKIVAQTNTAGTLYVDWEDMEQGSDFDQDMWGTIKYIIDPTAGTVTITTYVAAESTNDKMGFGYILSGTTSDGFKVYSGIEGFTYTGSGSGCTAATPCNVRNTDTAAQTRVYTLGTSTDKALEDPLKYAAKWGGYDDDSATVASIAASQPANYFFATDPRKLKASLKTALDKITKSIVASATAASSSTRLDSDTLVYQAIFSSTDWSGKISAYKILPDGSTKALPEWTTDSTLTRTDRTIYTYDGGSSRSLVNLTSTALTALSTDGNALRANLKLSAESNETNATKRYNWLLGSSADEIVKDPTTGAITSGTLRARKTVLGDIVNSTPALAGQDTQHYEELPIEYGSGSYAAYVNDTKKTRTPVLYVGANDGMLHAFNGKTGSEIFAYIPRGAYSKLAGLSSLSFDHQYIVDGSVTVGDAYVQLAGETAKSWHTIVVGSLGAGGRGVFALDVTVPTSPKVIFDISDTDSSFSSRSDLGYNNGKIFIVPTAAASGSSSWSVIFGNGGNSTNGYAKMVAINLESSSTTVIDTKAKMSTGDLLANGLSGVSLIPNGDGIYTYAYAGDFMGNMWKFDLTATSSTSWKVAYGTTSAPLPLVTVIDPSGVAQPITAAPTIGKNTVKLTADVPPVPSNMVYFGTGKLSESGDKSTTQIQTLYGILDSGAAIATLTTANRATILHQKTISAEANGQRTITGDKTTTDGTRQVDWTTKKGWFLDLKFGSTATGERIIAKPLLLYDRVIINTFIPSTYQCDYGGSGWLMELTGVGDKFIGYDLLGTHANHVLDNVILGNLIAIFGNKKVDIVGSGLKPDGNGNGSGSIKGFLKDKPSSAYGRMSWRQLK
ncbi:MAG: hypothetical protein EOO52_18930 [Gammaproteobacteria bacterium]|nr:MAG: hypothetical protein EOO52_18930 [Gammaproteobacteria bacterium]